MQTPLKLILAALLIGCLINFPYSYYQFVRIAATFVFVYLAFIANVRKSNFQVFLYIALAILFQPFVKIALGRAIWNIVDVLVAIGLLLSIIINKDKIKK